MRSISQIAGLLLCAAAVNAQVTVTSPSNNATVGTPTQFVASAVRPSSPITAMRIYVDNNSASLTSSNTLNTQLTMPSGAHYIVVQAWDGLGNTYKSALNVTVGATQVAPGVAVSAPTNNASVTAPMAVVAQATPSTGAAITATQIYVDNNLAWSGTSASINATLPLSSASHYIVVQAWDSAGQVFKTPVNVTVTGQTSTASVAISAPATGATVNSPAQVTGTATPSNGATITATQVFVDGSLAWSGSSANINASVPVSVGSHTIMVKATDSKGLTANQSVSVTASLPPVSIPSTAKLFDNIDQMGQWQSCSACAGQGGAGPVTPYTQTLNQATPSMDGNSSQFWLGGTSAVPYADALWWNQLGAQPAATNFVYDLYFYIQTPQYAQALEFDANQSVNGKKFIFGTQCNIRGGAQWDVWDGAQWQHTGITCNAPSAYTWHHVILEFSRTSTNVNFLSVSLDGNRQYINRSYPAITVNAAELNVAFQIDGDYAQHNYSVWLDKVRFFYW